MRFIVLCRNTALLFAVTSIFGFILFEINPSFSSETVGISSPTSSKTDVGELIGETTIEKAGLLSPDLFKVYPHFVNAYDSVYKIADNVADWYRAPIMVLYNDSASTSLDFLTFLYSTTDGMLQSLKRFFIKPERVKYYKKGRDIFVSFTYDGTQPNHAYILSPHGAQLVGTPDIIDDSFTEITETL